MKLLLFYLSLAASAAIISFDSISSSEILSTTTTSCITSTFTSAYTSINTPIEDAPCETLTFYSTYTVVMTTTISVPYSHSLPTSLSDSITTTISDSPQNYTNFTYPPATTYTPTFVSKTFPTHDISDLVFNVSLYNNFESELFLYNLYVNCTVDPQFCIDAGLINATSNDTSSILSSITKSTAIVLSTTTSYTTVEPSSIIYNNSTSSDDDDIEEDTMTKRQGEPDQSNVENGVTSVTKEIKQIEGDDEFKKKLSNDTFVGALSTYVDLYHGSPEDQIDPNLNLCHNLWVNLWTAFWKQNNHPNTANNAINIQHISNMFILATPTYANVYGQNIQQALDFLTNAYKDGSIYWPKEANNDDKNFINKLVHDKDYRDNYYQIMLNFYYEYGLQYGKEGDKSKRLVNGYGARKQKITNGKNADKTETKFSDLNQEAVAAGFLGVSGGALGLIFGSLGGNAALPVTGADAAKDLQDEMKDPHTSTYKPSPTTTKTTTSSSADACSTYLNSDGEVPLESDEVYPTDEMENFNNKKGTKITGGGRGKFKDMCGNAKTNPKFEQCVQTLGRHMIAVQHGTDNIHGAWEKAIGFRKNPFDLDGGLNDFYYRTKTELPTITFNGKILPIYIVNQQGHSPGVACNALKFIANNFDDENNYGLFTGIMQWSQNTPYPGKDSYNGAGMLTLTRNSIGSRNTIIGKYACSKNDNINTFSTKDMSWERDEFPPYSANFVLKDSTLTSVTCVPCYDNQIDGCLIGRFYRGTKSKPYNDKKIKQLEAAKTCRVDKQGNPINKKNNRIFPGMSLEGECVIPDYSKNFPNQGADEEKRSSVEKGTEFIILVNIHDSKERLINCANFDEGSDYKYKN